MKSFVLWSFSLLTLVLVFLTAIPKATTVFAAAGDITGAAWSANIGWINLGNGAFSYGVKMAPTGTTRALSGYAWSSNIGWVNFNNTACPPGYSGNCQPRVEWGTTGGPSVLVNGFIRACSVFTSGCSGTLKAPSELGGWDGFISLGDSTPSAGPSYGVRLNTTTGIASGYGWGSEVVGWVDFSGVRFAVGDPVETCFDRIQNQDETGIDIGGTCDDGGDGDGDPVCRPGDPCWCDLYPSDLVNCPGCPTNPAVGTPCWCAIPANATATQCTTGSGGMCSNIPDPIEIRLNITENSFVPPDGKYRKVSNGDGTNRCLCIAGYTLNPTTFVCSKPVYTEQ